MPVFLDTTGRASLGVGICARCSCKMSILDLSPDPNSPGLMVCEKDKDVLDPYRLPARQTEDLTLPFYRPDVNLTDPSPFLPVRDILGLRLETSDGRAIVNEDGEYLDVVIAPGPRDLP
jgi:hypothetical protein